MSYKKYEIWKLARRRREKNCIFLWETLEKRFKMIQNPKIFVKIKHELVVSDLKGEGV